MSSLNLEKILQDMANKWHFFLSEDDFRYKLTCQIQKEYSEAEIALEVKPWTFGIIQEALLNLVETEEEKKIIEHNMKFARFKRKTNHKASEDSKKLEVVREKDGRPAFDIWICDYQTKVIHIVELKYLVKTICVKYGGATFHLKSGEAVLTDIGAFIADMMRMELAVAVGLLSHEEKINNIQSGFSVRAYSILLTNEPRCWQEKVDERSALKDIFRVNDGRIFNKNFSYQTEKKRANATEEAKNIFTFANEYIMKWCEYSNLNDLEIVRCETKKELPRIFKSLVVEVPCRQKVQ